MGHDGVKDLDFIFPVSKPTLNNFLDICASGIVFLNEDGAVRYANKKFLTLLDTSLDEVISKPLLDCLAPKDKPKIWASFQHLIGNGQTSVEPSINTVAISNDARKTPISVTFNSVYEGNQRLIFCVVEDISSHVNLHKELYKQTITDPLTNLYNRRYFDERLHQEFKRSNRYFRPFSVIIIDIDGFKQANDLFGHAFGDQMLIKATKTFKTVLRQEDTVYRYGGDEFAMILPETPKEGGAELAERLKNIFAADTNQMEKRIHLSLSLGIASYPEDGKDEKSLIGAADRRMYASKERGGNTVTAYDDLNLNDETSAMLLSLNNLAHLMEKKRGHGSQGLHHSQSIRSMATEIGHRMGLSSEQLSLLEQAAILHDIGSISISASILDKTESLTDDEWQLIKKHTLVGEEIIDMIMSDSHQDQLSSIKQIIGQHHERLDGSGYPRGLKADDICIEAKILAVSDVYSALRSKRPYREAFTRCEALEEIRNHAGTYYATEVVDQLLQIESD